MLLYLFICQRKLIQNDPSKLRYNPGVKKIPLGFKIWFDFERPGIVLKKN